MKTTMNIYESAKTQGIPMGSHCSDLYLKKCEASEKLVGEYEFRCNVTTFRSQIDGTLWYDIPFAYGPGWPGYSAAQAEHNENLVRAGMV